MRLDATRSVARLHLLDGMDQIQGALLSDRVCFEMICLCERRVCLGCSHHVNLSCSDRKSRHRGSYLAPRGSRSPGARDPLYTVYGTNGWRPPISNILICPPG